jgi:two-component system sensor histidine kinase AlgZ
MNSIASLIASDPKTAESAVEDLAELFRASLDEVTTEIPLTDELDLCQRYAHMEGLRLGKRQTMNWQVENMPKWIKIPILTIQPLVENAIYHGIQPLTEGGTVEVITAYENPMVCIEVRNPMPNEQAIKHSTGNRMALDNIQARLTALYGSEAKLHTEAKAGTYVVSLRYPYAEDRLLKEQD